MAALASRAFPKIRRAAYVLGIPPRTSFRWGYENHLDELLGVLEEQVNLHVLRDVLAFRENASKPQGADDFVVKDDGAARHLRGAPVILVDNLWNTGATALSATAKILQLGAAEVHLCILACWLEGEPAAIAAASEYRQ